MWDLASLRAMNEQAQLKAESRGVVHRETRYDIGWHSVVDVKIYGDGHQLLTCRGNSCQALTAEELEAKPCGRPRRTGW